MDRKGRPRATAFCTRQRARAAGVEHENTERRGGASHQQLQLLQRKHGVAEVERAGIGVSRVVDEEDRLVAGAADAIVDGDERASHDVRALAEETGEVLRRHTAELAEDLPNPRRVTLGET